MSWQRVRVPASSANLGPGFDALGLALASIWNAASARVTQLRICVTGRDADVIPCTAENLIWQTVQRVALDVNGIRHADRTGSE